MSAVGVMACVALGNTQYQWDRHTWDVEMSVIPGKFVIISPGCQSYLATACGELTFRPCVCSQLPRSSEVPGSPHVSYMLDPDLTSTMVFLRLASLKVIFIIRILWGSSLCLVRLSVLCLYYRLLDLCQGQRYRWVLHIITAGTVGLLLMFLFTGFLACMYVLIPLIMLLLLLTPNLVQ